MSGCRGASRFSSFTAEIKLADGKTGWGGARAGSGRKRKAAVEPLVVRVSRRRQGIPTLHKGVAMAWYCVRSEQSLEQTAWREIAALGFETFFPRAALNRPLFGRYFFARFDVGAPGWRRICSARGVQCILGASPIDPTPVPDAAIQIIRAQLDALDCLMSAPAPAPDAAELPQGARVAVRGGAFDGIRGLAGQTDAGRVSVLLSLMGRDVTVSVDRKQIELAA
jgi:transcription antitermination factor NusG